MEIDDVKKYLDNELDEEERKALEAKLELDSTFKGEFEVNRSILSGMEDHFDQKLKQRLKLRDTVQPVKKQKYRPLVAAASVLLVTIAGFLFYRISADSDTEKLFAYYYNPYYNIIDESNRGEYTEQSRAFRLYNQRDFPGAALAFEKALEEDPQHEGLLFYSGISHLAAGDADKAVEKFKQVADSGHSFQDPAKWYCGLAYLKQGQKEKARVVFRDLSAAAGDYQDRAGEVLEKLE